MSEPTVPIGPYTQGEIPPPITETFQDENKQPIDFSISGPWVARWEYRRHRAGAAYPFDAIDTAAVVNVAVVDPDQVNNKGAVTYTWTAADFTLDGDYEGEMWIGNGVNRYCSAKYAWHTRPALAVPGI
jgi:hypothetical protein